MRHSLWSWLLRDRERGSCCAKASSITSQRSGPQGFTMMDRAMAWFGPLGPAEDIQNLEAEAWAWACGSRACEVGAAQRRSWPLRSLWGQFDSTNYITGKPCARGRDTKVSQTQTVPHQARNLVWTNGQRDNLRTMWCVLIVPSANQTWHSASMCLVLPLAWPSEDPGVLSAECILQCACCIWLCLCDLWSMTLQVTECLHREMASHQSKPCHVVLLLDPEYAFFK